MHSKLLWIVSLATFVGLFAGCQKNAHRQRDAEKQAGDNSYDQVAAAQIRITTNEGPRCTGVILSPQGLVLIQAVPELDGKELSFLLVDGRKANGVLLGWTEEWNVSIAQITDDGPWPFVELSSPGKKPSLGDSCILVGHRFGEDGQVTVVRRDTTITRTASNVWFSTESVQTKNDDGSYFRFDSLYDDRNTLLGRVGCMGGKRWIWLHVDQIRKIRDQIANETTKSLDATRLQTISVSNEHNRPYSVKLSAQENPADARQKAIQSSVRVCSLDGIDRSSGVIISPDGYVVSCGHGFEEPGTDVVFELPDGAMRRASSLE